MHGSFPGFQSQPFSIWLGQKAERTNIIIFEMCINYFESLKTIKSFPNKGCYIISICFYFNDKTVWFGTWTVWSDVCDRVIYLGNMYCFMMIICDYQFSKMIAFQGRILSFWYAKTDTVESLQRYMHRTNTLDQMVLCWFHWMLPFLASKHMYCVIFCRVTCRIRYHRINRWML